MKYVSKSITRFGHRNVLKLRKSSPTILVVGGVFGLATTAVMAAKATRSIDPILDRHAKQRIDIAVDATDARDEQRKIVKLYSETAFELGKLYAPSIIVGTISAGSVLHGHRILNGRHIATMAAYTGLMEQYQAYRDRVSETVGPELEQNIYDGAVGKWEEDPNHKGEYKMKAKFAEQPANYLRPFFDEANPNWTTDPTSNYYFLKGVQAHMNRLLDVRGHLFLFEVYDALGIPRTKETIVAGWLAEGNGDRFVDFGFMTDQSPEATMFRNGAERSVRLNFNIDGVIWDLI
jgi:Family of unknown function (DUF6353)